MNCTVAIAADNERELLEAAVQHAVAVHGHTDTPEFRKQLASAIKQGTPPLEAPAQQGSLKQHLTNDAGYAWHDR